MRKILANIGWIFFDRIFRMASGLLIGVWLARYLGPAEFGVLNYSLLFPTIFSALAGLGFTNVLMAEYVLASPIRQYQLVSTSFIMRLLAGCVAYGVTIGLNYFVNRNDSLLFLLINITGLSLIFQSSDVVDTYFQSQTKAKLSIVAKLAAFTISVVIRAYGLITHRTIVFFAVVSIIELILSFTLVLIVYKQYTKQSISFITNFFDITLIRNLIKIAAPIMFSEFFVFLYMKVDQFMLESLSTHQQLGLYGAALRLSEPWYFIAIAISSSFYPKIASLWSVDKSKFYQYYEALLNGLLYVSISLAAFVFLFSDFLVEIIYGPAFDGAGSILSVHIWAGVFVFLAVGTSNLMIMHGLEKIVFVKTIYTSLINVGLNFLLIPYYGALGSAIATLVAQLFAAYILNYFFVNSKHIFYIQSRAFFNVLTLKKLNVPKLA